MDFADRLLDFPLHAALHEEVKFLKKLKLLLVQAYRNSSK